MKKKCTKLLAGLLCAAMLSGDLMSAGILSLAAEVNPVQETETQTDAAENTCSEPETESPFESMQTPSVEISENGTGSENQTQQESISKISETMETETIGSETDDIPESEVPETQTQVMLDADGNIASGEINDVYGHITWTIDADGKLTATGTGDFCHPDSYEYTRSPWRSYNYSIKSAEINITDMTNAACLFYDCSSLTTLDLSGFDTSKVTNMYAMFGGCSSLTTLDLSGFNTSKVTKMNSMFSGCSSLTTLDLSNFDTSKVFYMIAMFQGCSSLTTLDLSGLDTSKVISMYLMFDRCPSLTTLDLSDFNTSNVTDMSEMFCDCSSLTTLDLSNFNTSNVTNMYAMFENCYRLTALDLSSFDTSNVTSMREMFSSCSALTTLDLSSFNAANVINEFCMFAGCSNVSTIYTPYNVKVSIWLPTDTSSDEWYRSDGTIVTELPQNLSDSIVLGKNYIPGDSIPQDETDALQLVSVKYTYGLKTVDVSKEPYTIDIEHGKFKLTCNAKNPNTVKEYSLYAGKSKIYVNETGVFDNLAPKDLQGEKIYIETKGTGVSIKRRIFLNIVEIPKLPGSISLFSPGISLHLDDDVPILGGDTYTLDILKLPINGVLEDGKIKIGINIKKGNLYSSPVNTDAQDKNDFWKTECEKISKAAHSLDYNECTRILDDLTGYMENGTYAAKIPGVPRSVDWKVFFYGEADWSDSLEKIQGQLVIQLTGKATFETQTVIWVIPVTVNCELTASGSLTGTLGYDFIESKIFGNVESLIKGSIEPYAGIGFERFASVGVYGKAEMGLNITLISSTEPSGISSWYLYGDAGVKAYFANAEAFKLILISTDKLKKTRLKEFINDSGQLLLYSVKANSVISPKKKNIGEPIQEDPVLYSYNYGLSKFSNEYIDQTAEWNDCKEAVAYASEDSDHVLINDVYEASSPQVATVENTTVLLYIDHDTSRAVANQTLLKYRIYDHTTKSWSEPKTACENGTADFNPVVYSDGSNIYVAYLNSSTKYEEEEDPDIETYAASFGVSVLQYDAVGEKFINLGSVDQNDCYCYSPKLTMSEQGLCVAWAENSDNSLFGLTNNNRIMTSIFHDGKFSAPVTVASGLPSVTSLAIGKNGSTDSLAYTVDADNNFATTEQELYLTAFSGNPVKVTEGVISNLLFTLLPDVGSSVLACNANGALSYLSDNSFISLMDEKMMPATDFIVDGNRILFLMNQNESRNVAAAVYDQGDWNTVMLTSETDYVDSFTYDGTMFSYLVTEAVKNDVEDTWDTCSAIKTLKGIEQCDIALYRAIFEPEDIRPGEKLPVKLTIYNGGISELSNLGITIKKSDGSGQTQKFVLDGKLAAGEVREYTVEMTLPNYLDASCIYTVTIDAGKSEANIENNSCELDMSLTDLTVSTAYLLETNSDDESVKTLIPILEARVTNDSHIATEGSIVVKDQNGTTIFSSEAEHFDAKEKKIYKVDLTEYLPADGTSVLFTTEIITEAQEYYKSNNNDDKTAYRLDDIEPEITYLSKGIEVTDLKESGYEYTGKAVKPSLFVYNNGQLLEEGTDYTLSYEHNVNVYDHNEGDIGFHESDSPKVLVSFNNTVMSDDETVSTITKYFKIIPKDISGSDVTCSDAESYEDGSVQHPDVTISANGTLLVKDIDYTLTYPDEDNDAYKVKGIYNILVSGIGNYSGSKYITFTIHHIHSWGNDYDRDGDGHWHVCSCDEKSTKEDHVYGDWSITKDFTDTENGIRERICSVCSYKDIAIIAIKDENGEEKPSETESSEENSSENEGSSEEIPSETENNDEEKPSETESSEENSSENESSSEEIPSENESIWGDILLEDRPLSASDIPNGLWIAGINESGYTYSSEAIIPVTRVYDKTTLLTEKTDYTISYKNNINVGEATIIVTGKGNYSGKETFSFNITPANIESDVYADSFYVKTNAKKALKPVPELYYMGTKLKNNKDFTITYSNTSGIYTQVGEYSVTVTGKNNYTGTKTVTLTAVDQIPKKKPVNITKATIDNFEKSFLYTGKACKQECTLKMQTDNGEKNLIEGTDYTVRYISNIKAGTAAVTYYGKNGYTGKLKKTYKILPYDIANDEAKKIAYNKTITCSYAKGGAKPKPNITFDGKVLREGTDYTLSYKNNKTVGSAACVTINGKGNFKGKIAIDFTITPQDLSKMTLVSCDKIYKNKAGNHKIVPKLMDLDGKLLSAGKDFDKNNITYVYENEVTLKNGIEKKAGDPVEDTDILPADTQIRVTFGCGNGDNYTGTFTGVYRIVKADIKSAKVTIPNQTYTGKEITLDKSIITVTLSGTTLKPEDYDIVQYTDNIKKGKASVTIKGNGNYGGTKTVKFNIGTKGFLWWWRKS